ncbi:MAG: formimidoylglutamate deiminase [Acidobacteriota bacterium]
MTTIYEIEHLHQPDGWLTPGYLHVSDGGVIEAVKAVPPPGGAPVMRLAGFGIPGLANLHSHAFQRAMAGRTEHVSETGDDDTFWTWRSFMYDFVARLRPEQYEAIGAFAYLEMIKFGMTAVGEFHYVHHAPDGTRYANHAEMAERLIAAADRAGIAITMLPVLYAHAGIGRPPSDQQRRFVHADVGDFLSLVERLRARKRDNANLEVGMAIHSLRAVAPDELAAAVRGALAGDPGARLHIHVSEQPREVEEIRAGLGARPVQWMLDNAGLNGQWTLVHATHMDEGERRGLAKSGAVAGLCPVTEATLGDGVFPLVDYQRHGGIWGIGTDGHYTTSTAEELRMLECGQRLKAGKRNMLASPGSPVTRHSGRRLFDLALAGGRQSLGIATGALTPGMRADLVVLDAENPTLIGHGPATVLDAWILSGTTNPVRDVMAAGRWMVRNSRHAQEEAITAAYKTAMRELNSAA